MPAMIVIATAGYTVNFFANMKFSSSAPIAYTFGAFTIGVLANLYSRLRHGVAAAVLLPAVYVQVPGSLASSGSINSALQTASALIKGSGGAGDVRSPIPIQFILILTQRRRRRTVSTPSSSMLQLR